MATYLKDGVSIAARINNKGPLLLDENGKLQSKILKAYEEYGFYIFENVIDERIAYQITSMLEGAIKRGTGRRLKDLNLDLAGKTGTTNENTDAWFIGYTSNLVVGG